MNPEHFIPHLASPTRVGVFGTSCNPPHVGHSMAILYAMSMNDFDQIWVVPCGEHPEGKGLIGFGHRFQMARIAFNKIRNCRVTPLEFYLPKPSFTNDTLKFITNAEPNAELSFIVGADCIDNVPKWKGGKETMRLAKLVGVPRSGFDEQGHLLPDISSSEIRTHLKKNESVERHLDFGVRQYISKHGLYPAQEQQDVVNE